MYNLEKHGRIWMKMKNEERKIKRREKIEKRMRR